MLSYQTIQGSGPEEEETTPHHSLPGGVVGTPSPDDTSDDERPNCCEGLKEAALDASEDGFGTATWIAASYAWDDNLELLGVPGFFCLCCLEGFSSNLTAALILVMVATYSDRLNIKKHLVDAARYLFLFFFIDGIYQLKQDIDVALAGWLLREGYNHKQNSDPRFSGLEILISFLTDVLIFANYHYFFNAKIEKFLTNKKIPHTIDEPNFEKSFLVSTKYFVFYLTDLPFINIMGLEYRSASYLVLSSATVSSYGLTSPTMWEYVKFFYKKIASACLKKEERMIELTPSRAKGTVDLEVDEKDEEKGVRNALPWNNRLRFHKYAGGNNFMDLLRAHQPFKYGTTEEKAGNASLDYGNTDDQHVFRPV